LRNLSFRLTKPTEGIIDRLAGPNLVEAGPLAVDLDAVVRRPSDRKTVLEVDR
jgi:hypothetical protein